MPQEALMIGNDVDWAVNDEDIGFEMPEFIARADEILEAELEKIAEKER